MRLMRILKLVLIAGTSVMINASVHADTAKIQRAADTSAAATPAVEVNGFRSAKFGMSEADVKAAIVKDLGVKADAITAKTNASEKTHILSVKAPDVLPGGGTAEVGYVFGYKSKTLIQVVITWSKATDDKLAAEQLFSNANMLREHFLTEGYKADTVATNMPISNGLLMFRGGDEKNRTTLLILQGTTSEGQNKQRILNPTALVLFYLADAKSPDVYRLPPGSF